MDMKNDMMSKKYQGGGGQRENLEKRKKDWDSL